MAHLCKLPDPCGATPVCVRSPGGETPPPMATPVDAEAHRDGRARRPFQTIPGQPPRLDRVRPAAAVAHRPDPGPRRRRHCHRSAAAAGAGLRRLGASGSGGGCRADAPGGERRPGPVDPGSLPVPSGALPGPRNGPLGRLGAPLPVRVLPASRPASWGRREAGRTGRAAEARGAGCRAVSGQGTRSRGKGTGNPGCAAVSRRGTNAMTEALPVVVKEGLRGALPGPCRRPARPAA